MTVTVFEYLISINIDFYGLISPFHSLVLAYGGEDISNTQGGSDHISKHLNGRQNYSEF